jgi:hypothetical protein
LLAVGADEEHLSGSDAVVDPDLVCSYVVTCFARAPSRKGEWGLVGEEPPPDATMADTGLSAIRHPPLSRRTTAGAKPADPTHLVLAGGQVGMLTTVDGASSHFPAMPVTTGFPARIHG